MSPSRGGRRRAGASPPWPGSCPRSINLRVEETVKLGIFNAMKYGWTLRGVDCGFCRAPFRPLDGAAREKMAQLMALPLEPV